MDLAPSIDTNSIKKLYGGTVNYILVHNPQFTVFLFHSIDFRTVVVWKMEREIIYLQINGTVLPDQKEYGTKN